MCIFRYFADEAADCPRCTVVHNNWIVSKAAKVYRFKEMHLWMYDGDSYYSNTHRKYLQYDNIKFLGSNFSHQKVALQNAFALGRILNRTVILPKFDCTSKKCPLNYYIHMKSFDNVFALKYRESTFLSHPKVSESVRTNVSPLLHIKVNAVQQMEPNLPQGTKLFVPADQENGANDEEIRQWYTSMNDIAVLRFSHLYKSFKHFIYDYDNSRFINNNKYGFLSSDYRQLHVTAK